MATAEKISYYRLTLSDSEVTWLLDALRNPLNFQPGDPAESEQEKSRRENIFNALMNAAQS